jgi:hypothetical protein
MSSFSSDDTKQTVAAAIATAGRASEQRKNALAIIEEAMNEGKLNRLYELASKDNATPTEIQETGEILNLFYKIHLSGNYVCEDMGNKSSQRNIGEKVWISAFIDNETIEQVPAVILNVLPPRRGEQWMFRVEYKIRGAVVNKAIYESEIFMDYDVEAVEERLSELEDNKITIQKLLDEKRVLEDRIGQCAPSVRDFLRS